MLHNKTGDFITDHHDGDEFRKYIREIPDFPKKNILFRDITPLLQNGEAFGRVVDRLADRFQNQSIDVVACVEARGFIIGSALANKMRCGIVPVRKKGKLPWMTTSEMYDLEYGQDVLEIHQDAVSSGQRVLIVDDVLATGGTAKAVVSMVNRLGGKIVCVAFLIELAGLEGRKKLDQVPIYSMLKY